MMTMVVQRTIRGRVCTHPLLNDSCITSDDVVTIAEVLANH